MLSVFLLAPAGLSGEETEGALWRYTFEEPQGDWRAAEFDDSQWQRGAPGFGNQDLPAFQRGRVKTEWSTPHIWIRFDVDLLETPWWAALVFSHDEDLEIYVNGHLAVEEKGFITGYAQKYLDCGSGGILKKGRNLVAAHCVQRTGGQFVDTAFESYRGETRITPQEDAVPRPEYPRPQLKRNEWLNLNGTWEFEIDRKGTGLERGLHRGKRLERCITVPFAPESALSGVGETDFLKRVWYFRGVQIPESWDGQRLLLHFGAVDYTTTVWVNGRKAGEHRGGFTPFCIDITPFVVDRYAGITVLAEDPMDDGLQATGKQSRKLESHGCVYTRTTGIWQTVWLEPVPAVRVGALRVEGMPDQSQVLVNVQLEGAAAGAVVHGSVYLEGAAMGEASTPARWRGTRLTIPLSEVKLWNPGDPHLYDLMIRVESKGEAIDSVETYFGLRTIEIDGVRVLINGRSVFQRLVLDQGFYPKGIFTAPSDEALVADIEMAMDLGFNGARLHMKLFEPRFLYWADRRGYLIWGEYPNWGLDYSDPRAMANHQTEWFEALERDRNHPSIVGWCPFNETRATQYSQGILNAYLATRAADPTRPVIDTSGYVHVRTDIYDCHNYTQDAATLRALFDSFARGGTPWNNSSADAPYGGQPFMVSEFGGTRWGPGKPGWGYGNDPKNVEEFYSRFEELCTALMDNPRFFGFCYTQLYDIEQEMNGLYTYERQLKFNPERIRPVLTRRAAIED